MLTCAHFNLNMIFSPLQCVDDDRQGEEQMQQVHDEHGEAAHQFDLNMQVDWQYDSGIQY